MKNVNMIFIDPTDRCFIKDREVEFFKNIFKVDGYNVKNMELSSVNCSNLDALTIPIFNGTNTVIGFGEYLVKCFFVQTFHFVILEYFENVNQSFENINTISKWLNVPISDFSFYKNSDQINIKICEYENLYANIPIILLAQSAADRSLFRREDEPYMPECEMVDKYAIELDEKEEYIKHSKISDPVNEDGRVLEGVANFSLLPNETHTVVTTNMKLLTELMILCNSAGEKFVLYESGEPVIHVHLIEISQEDAIKAILDISKKTDKLILHFHGVGSNMLIKMINDWELLKQKATLLKW